MIDKPVAISLVFVFIITIRKTSVYICNKESINVYRVYPLQNANESQSLQYLLTSSSLFTHCTDCVQ